MCSCQGLEALQSGTNEDSHQRLDTGPGIVFDTGLFDCTCVHLPVFVPSWRLFPGPLCGLCWWCSFASFIFYSCDGYHVAHQLVAMYKQSNWSSTFNYSCGDCDCDKHLILPFRPAAAAAGIVVVVFPVSGAGFGGAGRAGGGVAEQCFRSCSKSQWVWRTFARKSKKFSPDVRQKVLEICAAFCWTQASGSYWEAWLDGAQVAIADLWRIPVTFGSGKWWTLTNCWRNTSKTVKSVRSSDSFCLKMKLVSSSWM